MSDSKKKPQQALYHRDGWKPKVFTVAAENEDGTVDLADESGTVVVTKCPVAQSPENGHATLGEAELALEAAEKEAAEKEAAEKEAAEKEAAEKEAAADPPKKKAASGGSKKS